MKVTEKHLLQVRFLAARKFLLPLFTAMIASASLTACNTLSGVGEDIEAAGEKIEEQAEERQNY